MPNAKFDRTPFHCYFGGAIHIVSIGYTEGASVTAQAYTDVVGQQFYRVMQRQDIIL